jgi:hypothetical protein
MRGLWPVGEEAPALTYKQAAAKAQAPFVTAQARPTKAGLGSSLVLDFAKTTVGRTMVAYFFWVAIKGGYPAAARLWNRRIAPFVRKNTAPPGGPKGFEVKVPDMAPTWAEITDDTFELIRQLWGLVSNDPFPEELRRPPQLEAPAPVATPVPPQPPPSSPQLPAPTPQPSSSAGPALLFGGVVMVSLILAARRLRRRG